MTTFLIFTPVSLVPFIFFFVCLGVIAWGRKEKTGNPFNICTSAIYGMTALMAIPTMASEILHSQPAPPSLADPWNQLNIAAVSFAIGIGSLFILGRWHSKEVPKAAMDMYHHLVAVPLLVDAVLFTGVVIIYLQGSWWQWVITAICIWFWATRVFSDYKEGRLNQARYLESHPITHV